MHVVFPSPTSPSKAASKTTKSVVLSTSNPFQLSTAVMFVIVPFVGLFISSPVFICFPFSFNFDWLVG